jgi:hypothetical protein
MPSVGSTSGGRFVLPCGPTTPSSDIVEFPRAGDPRGGDGGPEILEAGMGVLRKRRDEDGKRERHRTEVRCPAQTRDYCATFHLIDKGNGAEASYDLGGKSRLHNWSPKLVFRLYNMALNNAYKMYTALVKEHTPEGRFLSMGDAVRELTHDLCQRGPAMRKLRAEHPSWTRDLGKLLNRRGACTRARRWRNRGSADGTIARVSWRARRHIRATATRICAARSAARVWERMYSFATGTTTSIITTKNLHRRW